MVKMYTSWKGFLKDVVTSLLVLLFVYTGVSKLIENDLFVFQMRLAPLPIMVNLAPYLGWIIPTVELLIATGLLINRFRLLALYSSVALLMLFMGYIITMMLSGSHLPCTCGGIISTMSWKAHLVFNFTFIILGLLAIKQSKIGRANINGL
jgi:hypothetical protein